MRVVVTKRMLVLMGVAYLIGFAVLRGFFTRGPR